MNRSKTIPNFCTFVEGESSAIEKASILKLKSRKSPSLISGVHFLTTNNAGSSLDWLSDGALPNGVRPHVPSKSAEYLLAEVHHGLQTSSSHGHSRPQRSLSCPSVSD